MQHAEYIYEYACRVRNVWNQTDSVNNQLRQSEDRKCLIHLQSHLTHKLLENSMKKKSAKCIWWWPGASCSVTAGTDSCNTLTQIVECLDKHPLVHNIFAFQVCVLRATIIKINRQPEKLLTITHREQIPLMKKLRTPRLQFCCD